MMLRSELTAVSGSSVNGAGEGRHLIDCFAFLGFGPPPHRSVHASLSMQAVAHRVGVRAPSLYKRVRGRDELIRLVAEASMIELARRLNAVSGAVQLANIFRAFGHERPAAFQLIVTPGTGTPAARPEIAAEASAAVLRLARSLAGESQALDAARTLTAWAVGFVSMELNGGFTLGGDVESAWQFGIERIVASFSERP